MIRVARQRDGPTRPGRPRAISLLATCLHWQRDLAAARREYEFSAIRKGSRRRPFPDRLLAGPPRTGSLGPGGHRRRGPVLQGGGRPLAGSSISTPSPRRNARRASSPTRIAPGSTTISPGLSRTRRATNRSMRLCSKAAGWCLNGNGTTGSHSAIGCEGGSAGRRAAGGHEPVGGASFDEACQRQRSHRAEEDHRRPPGKAGEARGRSGGQERRRPRTAGGGGCARSSAVVEELGPDRHRRVPAGRTGAGQQVGAVAAGLRDPAGEPVRMVPLGPIAPIGIAVEAWRRDLLARHTGFETGAEVAASSSGIRSCRISRESSRSSLCPTATWPRSRSGPCRLASRTFLIEELAVDGAAGAAVPAGRTRAGGRRRAVAPGRRRGRLRGRPRQAGGRGLASRGRAGARGLTWQDLPGTRAEATAVRASFCRAAPRRPHGRVEGRGRHGGVRSRATRPLPLGPPRHARVLRAAGREGRPPTWGVRGRRTAATRRRATCRACRGVVLAGANRPLAPTPTTAS